MAAINTEMIRERVIQFLQQYREYVKKIKRTTIKKVVKKCN